MFHEPNTYSNFINLKILNQMKLLFSLIFLVCLTIFVNSKCTKKIKPTEIKTLPTTSSKITAPTTMQSSILARIVEIDNAQQVFQWTQIALTEAQKLALQVNQATFAGIQSTISEVSDGIITEAQLIIEQANQDIKQANDIIHTVQDIGFLKKIQFLLHFNLLLIIIVIPIANTAEQAGKIEFHYIYIHILIDLV